jgi:ABC-type multidrug transport system fused ATPase/permease subunit
MVGRTSFMIAHRLSTIHRADVICVLDHGRLVQQGPHDELLAREGLYRQLYEIQNGMARRSRVPVAETTYP